MGKTSFETPVLVEERDYHDFGFYEEFFNLVKPDPPLSLYEDSYGKSDWFVDGRYYAIIYVAGIDDAEAHEIWKTLQEP